MRTPGAPPFSQLSLVACFLSLGACSSSSSSSAGIPKYQFVAQLGAAICDPLGTCCASLGFPYDDAACKATVTSGFQQAFGNPRFTYDPVAGALCVQAEKSAAASCFASEGAFDAACRNVITGNVPLGGACTLEAECASASDGVDVSCDAGVCAVMPRGKEGDPCKSTCGPVAGGWTCWPGGTTGNVPATGTAWCWIADGLACGAGGTCQRLAQTGQACVGGSCVDADYCANGPVCAVRVPVGGACSQSGVCVAGARCAWGTTSVGTCALPQGDGATCQSNDDCLGGNCDVPSHTCKGTPMLNAATCGG